jgi:hypothetical protein
MATNIPLATNIIDGDTVAASWGNDIAGAINIIGYLQIAQFMGAI